ncbi:MAG: outer membrane beta-barrel protein [Bacteroidetes bacterium]|nr:outer membrane beta-barrel protein [Bacteroidota bacterium]
MKYILSIVVLLSLSFTAQAQTATVNGRLVDTATKQSMENASISLLDSKDSTLEQFTLAKSNGFFEFKNLPIGNYILQISFQGFQPVYKKLIIAKDEPYIQLGNFYLKPQSKELEGVTVTTSPITIKKDTVEYSAGSFKTKPNATAEDLLKKMPGIQVDKDGNVKAQGEDVQRVLVDGKRFFGDDPKMATKNLPSDVIDKIQVFDAASDQSAFTGFDDGNRTKTINIVTKKDKRKGVFGKGSVGLGTDGNTTLNDNNLNLSNFNNGKQITVTAQSNNVNKQNFSVQDILGTLGSSGGGFGGGRNMGGMSNMIQSVIGNGSGNGVVNTWGTGLNFSNGLGKHSRDELNASGFYNNQRTNKNTTSLTENLVSANPDSSNFINQTQNSFTHNRNARFNLNIEKTLDSLGNNSIIFRPNISTQNTYRNSATLSNATKAKVINLNNSNAATDNQNVGYNANLDFTFRHRFKTKGRTMSLNATMGRNDNDGDGNNYSEVDNLLNNTTLLTNQHYNSFSSTKNYGTTLSYTEPIAKNSQIEIAYNHNYSQSESDKETMAYDSTSKGYTVLVNNLTNSFRNTYKSDRGTLSYRYAKDNFTFSVGNGVQWGNLNSVNRTTSNLIEQNYVNLFPTAQLTYSVNKSKNLRFNYNGRTAQPSVSQLQPVVDNSDPLNIKLGNADLQQKFTHNFRLFYNSFNFLSQKIFFATINANFTTNDIQNSIVNLQNGARITQPVNLNGTYNIIGFINYGFPLRKPKSNLNLGLNFTKMQSQSLLNNESNYSRNTTIGNSIIWTTNLKERWDVNFTSNTTFNLARYTLQPSQDADYFSQYVSTELTYYTKSGWNIATDFDYTYNGGRSSGYNTSIPLWNASISKQILKDKNAEIKLYVFDMLHANQAITRSVTASSVQDVNTNVLGNYFMLSFSYNLRKFKGQQNGMPQMPGGMMRMMRRGGGGF